MPHCIDNRLRLGMIGFVYVLDNHPIAADPAENGFQTVCYLTGIGLSEWARFVRFRRIRDGSNLSVDGVFFTASL